MPSLSSQTSSSLAWSSSTCLPHLDVTPSTKTPFTEQQLTFSYTTLLGLSQAFFTILVSVPQLVHNPSIIPERIPYKRLALLALCACLAVDLSARSLAFVDYPTQIVAKHLKPVSTMLFSIFLSKVYRPRQIITSSVILVGIAFFVTDKLTTATPGTSANLPLGLVLIVLSLVFDGFVCSQEDILIHRNNCSSTFVMLSNNVLALGILAVSSVLTGDLFGALPLFADWRFAAALVGYGVSGALGQFLVFKTIALSNTLFLTVLTTSRKLFSVALSVVLFHHPITATQCLGIAIVFSALFVDVFTR